jgi:hypothetical protein
MHAAISVRFNGFRSNCKISREFRARAFTTRVHPEAHEHPGLISRPRVTGKFSKYFPAPTIQPRFILKM